MRIVVQAWRLFSAYSMTGAYRQAGGSLCKSAETFQPISFSANQEAPSLHFSKTSAAKKLHGTLTDSLETIKSAQKCVRSFCPRLSIQRSPGLIWATAKPAIDMC